MRICLVLDSSLAIPGGVQSYICGLGDALATRGHRVTILATGGTPKGDRSRRIVSLGKIFEVPFRGADSSLPLILVNPFRIRQELVSGQYDIVHVPGHGGMLSWWAVLLSSAPVVASFLSFHESPVLRGVSKAAHPLFNCLNRRIKIKIAISQAAADYARLAFPGEYQIIPAGIDLKRFFPQSEDKSRSKQDQVTVLFVGRLDPRKGIGDFLEVFRQLQLQSRSRPLKAVVVGDGPERAGAEEFVHRYGLDDGVSFVGRVSDQDLPGYYRQADIYCSPAKGGESFGIVLLEAMASGLPVVAYRNRGYQEILDGELSSILVKPGDLTRLRSKLEQLVNSPDLRRYLGQQGRQRVKDYDWNRVAERIEKVYQEYLTRKLP